LKSLLLGENKIGDDGVLAITTSLMNISKLRLDSNCFSAESLRQIRNLKSLKVLDIRNNKLGDVCMQYLSELNELVELSVSKNSISD
jgi:Leucine-rich repeat (LRR) protein